MLLVELPAEEDPDESLDGEPVEDEDEVPKRPEDLLPGCWHRQNRKEWTFIYTASEATEKYSTSLEFSNLRS